MVILLTLQRKAGPPGFLKKRPAYITKQYNLHALVKKFAITDKKLQIGNDTRRLM
jgi:hypothetical protein